MVANKKKLDYIANSWEYSHKSYFSLILTRKIEQEKLKIYCKNLNFELYIIHR